jgi:hypothetical protein
MTYECTLCVDGIIKIKLNAKNRQEVESIIKEARPFLTFMKDNAPVGEVIPLHADCNGLFNIDIEEIETPDSDLEQQYYDSPSEILDLDAEILESVYGVHPD